MEQSDDYPAVKLLRAIFSVLPARQRRPRPKALVLHLGLPGGASTPAKVRR